MPVRKARFKKFDEGGVEEDSNPSGGVFSKSIFRNVRNSSFAPLVEDDFSVPSTSSNVLWDDRRKDDKITFPDDPFDSLANSAGRVSANDFNVTVSKQKSSEKKTKPSKIPQLKANRLDDLHYQRAKELVDMMDRNSKVHDLADSFEVKHEPAPIDLTQVESNDGWVHFDSKMTENDAVWGGFPSETEPRVEQTDYDDIVAPMISAEEGKVGDNIRQVGASLGAVSDDTAQDEDAQFSSSSGENEVDGAHVKRKRQNLDEARLYDHSASDYDDSAKSQDVFLSLNVGLKSGHSQVKPEEENSTMNPDFASNEDAVGRAIFAVEEEKFPVGPGTSGLNPSFQDKQETTQQSSRMVSEVSNLENIQGHHDVGVPNLGKTVCTLTPQETEGSLEPSYEKQNSGVAEQMTDHVSLSVKDTIVLEQSTDGEAVEVLVQQTSEQPLVGSEDKAGIGAGIGADRCTTHEALERPIAGTVDTENNTSSGSQNQVGIDSSNASRPSSTELPMEKHPSGKVQTVDVSHLFHSSLPTMNTIAEDSPQDDDLPNLEQSLSHQSTYVSARSNVRLGNSIHFRKMSPSSNSLLDTASDFHSDVCEEASVSDSTTQHSKAGRVIQLTMSSGSLSTITHPHQLSRSCTETSMQASNADSKARQKLEPEETGIKQTMKPSETIVSPRDPPFIPTGGVKPLGATTEEIIMLNTFMQIAAPKLKGSTLTVEDREEIHHEARQAGLPEAYINKLLDQSAGIMCWDDQSVSTVHTADVTEAGTVSGQSVKTKGTVSTASTGYTRDSEAISYYSYETGYKTPKSEVLGGFGCFEGFKKSFWAEAGLAGDDILENVTAAISSDSADSWDSHEHN